MAWFVLLICGMWYATFTKHPETETIMWIGAWEVYYLSQVKPDKDLRIGLASSSGLTSRHMKQESNTDVKRMVNS